MITRYLCILFFISILQTSWAQEGFSQSDLQEFIHIYMTSKKDQKRNAEADRKIFDQYNVSRSRYHEISQLALQNDLTSLSSNEKKLLVEIKRQNELLQEENLQKLELRCSERGISLDTYLAVLEKYKTDIQFQRSLKPHFDAYLKKQK